MASHQMESNYGDGGAGSTFYPVTIWIALVSTVIGCCISFLSVWLHWKNYRKPVMQPLINNVSKKEMMLSNTLFFLLSKQ